MRAPRPYAEERDRRARALVMERYAEIQFLHDRLDEAEEMVINLRVSTSTKNYLMRQHIARRRILDDYVAAIIQSNPERPSLWGREARFGLRTAVHHMLRTYADHPDYKEEW